MGFYGGKSLKCGKLSGFEFISFGVIEGGLGGEKSVWLFHKSYGWMYSVRRVAELGIVKVKLNVLMEIVRISFQLFLGLI